MNQYKDLNTANGNVLNNSDLGNESDEKHFDKELKILLQKIKNGVNKLTEVDYENILNVCICRMRGKGFFPTAFKELLTQSEFLKYVNNYIPSNLSKLLKESTVYTFEELSIYVSLLGLGKYFNLVDDLTTIEFDSIEDLCNEYIKKINVSIKTNNQEELDVNFNGMLNLVNTFNTLCILDSVNTYRKGEIPNIVSLMKSKLESLRYILENNSNFDGRKYSNRINHRLGMYYVNFTHVDFIESSGNLDILLEEFLYKFDDIDLGYKLCFDSNFGDNPEIKEDIDMVFKGNKSYLLSLLLYKLSKDNKKIVLDKTLFRQILKTFGKTFGNENLFTEIKSLNEIQQFCNNVYVGLYNGNLNEDLDKNDDKTIDCINDFIDVKTKHDDDVIESIHNLVLFNQIPRDLLLKLGNYLVSNDSYKNYSFEFYKLKILDTIIDKLYNGGIPDEVHEFFENVVAYVEKNKKGSQLLYPYSALYLTIAHSYSCVYTQRNIELARKYFIIFKKINNNTKNLSFKHSIGLFYYNIGVCALKSIVEDDNLFNEESDIDILSEGGFLGLEGIEKSQEDIIHTSDGNIVRVGKKVIASEYAKYSTNLENKVSTELTEIMKLALNHNDLSESSNLNTQISDLISNEIFSGITDIKIQEKTVGSHADFNHKMGSNYEAYDLNYNYEIIFNYPKIYKDVFQSIFSKQKEFILNNIGSIINAYLKRKNEFIDKKTGLQNNFRLRSLFMDYNKPTTIVMLKLNSLSGINSNYSVGIGDQYILEFSNLLRKVADKYGVKIYRLSGSKFGIMIENQTKVEDIYNDLVGSEIVIGENEVFKSDINFGVVKDSADIDLLEQANRALNESEVSGEQISYYSKEIKHNENFEYQQKIMEAYENNNIIPYYQPIVDLQTGKTVKYEVLLRVNENGKIQPPFKYINAALSTKNPHYSQLITKRMYELIYQKSIDNPDVGFTLNITGLDLANNKLIDDIIYLKEDSKSIFKPENLTIEVLESQFDYEKIKGNLKKLKQAGFKIAIDDYGTEHSNSQRLMNMFKDNLLDFVKIDRSLIQALLDENEIVSKNAEIEIRGLIEKAKLSNIKLVGEFIDSQKVLDICRELGVHYGQGYYLGKPNDTLDILK